MTDIDLDWVDKAKHVYCIMTVRSNGSNPNGDPDMEGSPRQLPDGRGWISVVSVRRRVRDLIGDKESEVWKAVSDGLGVDKDNYHILETRGRDKKKIHDEIAAQKFLDKYVDARLFGSTFLDEKNKKKPERNYTKTGITSMSDLISLGPIEVDISTITRKAGTTEDKDRGMAPGGLKKVVHGIYVGETHINMSDMDRFGCKPEDIKIFLRTLPHIYKHASAASAGSVVKSLWVVGFNTPLPHGINDGSLYALLCPKARNGTAKSDVDYVFVDSVPDIIKESTQVIYCGNAVVAISNEPVEYIA